MKKQVSGRSGLLLTELMLSILFFSVISAVCLQLFVKASLLGRDTRELDMAVRCAVSAAELLNETDEPLARIAELFPESYILTEEGIMLLFDEDFHSCGSTDMAYQMDILLAEEDDRTVSWSVILYGDRHTREIYRLDGTSYTPDIQQNMLHQKGEADS